MRIDNLVAFTFLFNGLYAIVHGSQAPNLFSGDPCVLLDGTPGVCKAEKQCKWLENEIRSGRVSLDRNDLEELRCTYDLFDAVTCCGDPQEADNRFSAIINAQSACDNYKTWRNPLISYHILGGNFSALGEFPHMAAIGYVEEFNAIIDFKCGGSIISARYILTAAHCGPTRLVKPVLARLGTINIIDPTIEHGELVDIQIETMTLHPDYKIGVNYHDIALIRLKQDVPFGINLHPACLRTDTADLLPSDELFVTGWGTTNYETNERSKFLLKANLTHLELDKCNETIRPFFGKKLSTGLNRGQLCAYDPDAMKDACYGDSGGPIQIIERDTHMPYIVGVTSFGIACGTPLPSIYARVSFYMDWIESIVWPN